MSKAKNSPAISAEVRKALIMRLIGHEVIDSQSALVDVLKREGVKVTQATASRDLLELAAYRGKDSHGVVRYMLPQGGAQTTSVAQLIESHASANLVVLRTQPGAAQLLASSLDKSELPGLIGTIAGDDTVIAISKSATGGGRLMKEIENFVMSNSVKSTQKRRK